jgi:enoyl reductase
MQVIRRATVLAAAVLSLGGVFDTARADFRPPGSTDSSCAFGPVQVLKGKAAGTDVSTSVSCFETASSSTPGHRGVTDWVPPKCWWEPITQADFDKGYADFRRLLHQTGEERDDPAYVAQFMAYYKDRHASDPGSWLQAYCEPDATPADFNTLGWDSVPGLWVWSPPGKPAPVGTAPTVTNATLAQIAAGQMTIPETKISMSPDQSDPAKPAPSIVTLPTWLWLDPQQFGTRSVTAQLKQFGLSATVTAVPEELDVTVDGGAVFSTTGASGPAASELICKARPGGSIGTVYTAGSGGASDCSLTFLKPSPQNGSYTLHAKVIWQLTWTGGPAAAGWPKTLYLTQDVNNFVVHEIQTTNG